MLMSRPSVGRIISVSQVLRYWGNLVKLAPNTPNHVQGHMKNNTKSSASCFTSSETLLQWQDPLWVKLYLFQRYSSIGAIWGNWAQIPQITCRDTRKVIQSLQILILHQMRPYSSVKALCGSSYTCFTGTQVLGQFGETWPEYPKSCTGTHEKQSKVFTPHFTSDQLLLQCLGLKGLSYTCFTGIWALGQFEETDPKYPKSCVETHKK